MNKRIVASIAFFCLAFACVCSLSEATAPVADAAQANAAQRMTGGQIIVRFMPGTTTAQQQRSISAVGARADSRRDIAKLATRTLIVPAGQEDAIIARLQNDPHVAYADRIHRYHLEDVPNDPTFSATNRAKEAWGFDAIHSTQAWKATHGSADVIVAVIDSGLDVNHPDVAGRVILPESLGWTGAPYPSNEDKYTHGTHVAGIIAAAGDNHIGMAGMAWNVKIMPIRVFDYPGSPDDGQDSVIAQAIVFAADHGASVINMSLGGADYTQVEADACAYAWQKGVFIAVAAGNNANSDPYYPASYDDTVAVAATDRNGKRAYFSNFGSFVDLAAPGVNIYSLQPLANGGYGYKSGTSMSTPYVSGTAALIKSLHPDYTPDQIFGTLKATATDLGPRGRDDFFGWGQINADAAVRGSVPPPTGAVVINDNAGPTADPQVTLSLTAQSNIAIQQVRISNRADFRDALTLAYDGTPQSVPWNLIDSRYGGVMSGGSKRVYVKYQDSNGHWSDTISDSIYLRLRVQHYSLLHGDAIQDVVNLTNAGMQPVYVTGTIHLATGAVIRIATLSIAAQAQTSLDIASLTNNATGRYTLRLTATAPITVQGTKK